MKKNRKYSLILVAAVFALSMGVFFLLYCFDNKYTAKGDRAIQGILYIQEDSVHYLTGEWEYYPDLLLTPRELEEHKEGVLQPLYFHRRIWWHGSWRRGINLLLEAEHIG